MRGTNQAGANGQVQDTATSNGPQATEATACGLGWCCRPLPRREDGALGITQGTKGAQMCANVPERLSQELLCTV